jgi:hypothetical protein
MKIHAPSTTAKSAPLRVFIPLSGDGPIIDYVLALGHHVTAIEIVDRPVQNLLTRFATRQMKKQVMAAPVNATVYTAADQSFVIHQVTCFVALVLLLPTLLLDCCVLCDVRVICLIFHCPAIRMVHPYYLM